MPQRHRVHRDLQDKSFNPLFYLFFHFLCVLRVSVAWIPTHMHYSSYNTSISSENGSLSLFGEKGFSQIASFELCILFFIHLKEPVIFCYQELTKAEWKEEKPRSFSAVLWSIFLVSGSEGYPSTCVKIYTPMCGFCHIWKALLR